MKLYGFLNVTKMAPTFVLPIFIDNNLKYIQTVNQKSGYLDNFIEFSVNSDETDLYQIDSQVEMPYPNHFSNIPPIYGFLGKKNKLYYGTKLDLNYQLRRKYQEFNDYPLVFLDVLEFMESYEEAYQFLESRNEKWAAFELKKFAMLYHNKTGNAITFKREKLEKDYNERLLKSNMNLEFLCKKRKRGKVKWFDKVKGIGMIESEDGEEIFIHRSQIVYDRTPMKYEGLNDIFDVEKGQEGKFDVVKGENGFLAENDKLY